MQSWVWLVAAGALGYAGSEAVFACWNEAAARYGVNADLLYAIARCESNLKPEAINRSHLARTGTYDIGLMQINSSHLRALARYGIDEQQLRESCTNIYVGAWLLADNIQRHGLTWDAIGAYNAACTELKGPQCAAARSRYAWCVYRHLQAPLPSGTWQAAAPVPTIATRVTP